jgi:hypothetical protein
MTEPLKCTIDDLADDMPNVFTNAKIVGDGIDYAEYSKQFFIRGQAGYVMSRTDLVEFDFCPARWKNGYRDEGSSFTEWGQLMDCLVLTPDEFTSRVAVCPSKYMGSKGEEKPWTFQSPSCRKWREIFEAMGKQVVTSEKAEQADKATEILREDEDILFMLENSLHQVFVTAEYRDAETGIVVPVKALIDIVPTPQRLGIDYATNSAFRDSLADFKTCSNAHPRSWAKHVFDYDLHTQAALYLDLYNAATGEQRDEFRHILQESFKPWQIGKRILSNEFVSLGRSKYQRILKSYCQCLKSNNWPGYDEPGSHDVVIDGWKVTEPIDWMLMI